MLAIKGGAWHPHRSFLSLGTFGLFSLSLSLPLFPPSTSFPLFLHPQVSLQSNCYYKQHIIISMCVPQSLHFFIRETLSWKLLMDINDRKGGPKCLLSLSAGAVHHKGSFNSQKRRVFFPYDPRVGCIFFLTIKGTGPVPSTVTRWNSSTHLHRIAEIITVE